MMTVEEYNANIWMYYLQLEEDFYKTLNFVEFSMDNFKTYSKEYIKQLLSIGSEIDVVCKELCKCVNPNAKRKCITDYADVLSGYNGLPDASVELKLTREKWEPLKGWDKENSPIWWKEYNEVKHARSENENQKKGNLKNVFSALAALYVLNRYLCKFIYCGRVMKEPEIQSKLFSMVGWEMCIPAGGNFVWCAAANGNLSLQPNSVTV